MFPNELLNYRDKSYKTVFRSIIMKPVRILFAATCFALFVFVVAVCLHEYLYSFDPYQWAFPGVESDMSRSLWLHRRDQYRMVDFISFILAMVFGFMTPGGKAAKTITARNGKDTNERSRSASLDSAKGLLLHYAVFYIAVLAPVVGTNEAR